MPEMREPMAVINEEGKKMIRCGMNEHSEVYGVRVQWTGRCNGPGGVKRGI